MLVVSERDKLPGKQRKVRAVAFFELVYLLDILHNPIESATTPVLLVGFLLCPVDGAGQVTKLVFDETLQCLVFDGVEIDAIACCQCDPALEGITHDLGKLRIEKYLAPVRELHMHNERVFVDQRLEVAKPQESPTQLVANLA